MMDGRNKEIQKILYKESLRQSYQNSQVKKSKFMVQEEQMQGHML